MNPYTTTTPPSGTALQAPAPAEPAPEAPAPDPQPQWSGTGEIPDTTEASPLGVWDGVAYVMPVDADTPYSQQGAGYVVPEGRGHHGG